MPPFQESRPSLGTAFDSREKEREREREREREDTWPDSTGGAMRGATTVEETVVQSERTRVISPSLPGNRHNFPCTMRTCAVKGVE